jgi:hypothetical protein
MTSAIKSGEALGLSSPRGGSSSCLKIVPVVHSVKPSSHFVFPALPALELLPPVTLVAPSALVRLNVSSGFSGSPASMPFRSSGAGSRDAFDPSPLLPVPEMLPLVSLVAPTASASPLVRSGTFGDLGFDAAPLPSSSVFVAAPFKDAYTPPTLSGAAELGERIRFSLPVLQLLKPFQRYYRRARELREGHSVKWNDVLLVDSLEASKKAEDTIPEPPVKNFAVSVKQGFLTKGFINPRPTVLAPPASHREVKDVRVVGPSSPPSCIIPSSNEGNGFSQS